MPYKLFEIPSADGLYADVVLADPNNPNAPAYTHYAYTIGTTANPNELTQRRGIPFSSFRNWEILLEQFPEIAQRFDNREDEEGEYYPGESVIESNAPDTELNARTAMRLGALEILGNIFSGRITASDKDPFPHQLALQQEMKRNQTKVQRLLIADEVGLGKTIEIGLVLRDLLIARGTSKPLSCLYLTRGGLLEDVRFKLQSVIRGAMGERNIVQVEKSFSEYGKNNIEGIHIASLDAARRCVKNAKKKELPTELVNPEILIIDEAHHCASEDDLINPERIKKKDTTRAYEAVYQIITGKFWQNSQPPKLVVFMSATPFRSKQQFVNLLRLLTHETAEIKNAFSPEIDDTKLLTTLRDNSSAAVIWRQHDDVRNWSDERLFPNFKIERQPLNTSAEYLSLIKEIRDTVKRICSEHDESFGGFATRQLEIRLTSSSITGAMWIFRWCVRHQTWQTQDAYKKDTSNSTEKLRELIRAISQKIAEFEQKGSRGPGHAWVRFASDDVEFDPRQLSQKGAVTDIYDFSKKFRQKEKHDEDESFIAEPNEVLELAELGLRLVNFANATGGTGVENVKLNWLKNMLNQYPESRFLVFTESLQTCELITKALQGESERLTGDMGPTEREKAVARFKDMKSPVRLLIATSAADEGLDFQVANRVVHWDLSPSPDVLMQRNGRVARLGQISDVIAYYLIIAGTHEEKREKTLKDKFDQLGIDDEKLRLKILGTLSNEAEEEIFRDVEENKLSFIDGILEKAKVDHEEMKKQLKEVKKQIDEQWVIDRKSLAQRLECWMQLKLPSQRKVNFNLTFDTVEWERPVFREQGTIMEKAEAKVVAIQDKRFIFDPEFKVFGKDKESKLLAGLYPWTEKEENHVLAQRPLQGADPIGELACMLARQSQADFAIISADSLYKEFPNLQNSRYLLFATHPLREIETNSSNNYLTFYAFASDLDAPIDSKGASPKEVYKLISLLEKQALISPSLSLDSDVFAEAKQAGRRIAKWVKDSRKLGGLTQKSYFLPLPVGLVAVLP